MSDVITEVWFENVDNIIQVLKFRNVPESKGLRPAITPKPPHQIIRVPSMGERVAWRGAAVGGDDAAMPLDLVVAVHSYYYVGEDGKTWVEEIHVMTSERD